MSDDRERVRATFAGQTSWGTYGDPRQHLRYSAPINPRLRRRCHCGCGGRATHVGCANGLGFMSGCPLSVRRWVGGSRA